MNISPRKGRGRPKRILVDEKATSTPHAPPLDGEPQAPQEFHVSSMPQPGFFPPMTLEAF